MVQYVRDEEEDPRRYFALDFTGGNFFGYGVRQGCRAASPLAEPGRRGAGAGKGVIS